MEGTKSKKPEASNWSTWKPKAHLFLLKITRIPNPFGNLTGLPSTIENRREHFSNDDSPVRRCEATIHNLDTTILGYRRLRQIMYTKTESEVKQWTK